MILKKTIKNSPESIVSLALTSETLTGRSGFLLAKAAQRVRDTYDENLKTLNMNARHAGILTILEEKGSLAQNELGKCAYIDRTTIVALIDDLEKLGLVERQEHPTDRRSHVIYMTAKGKDLMPLIAKKAKEVEKEYLGPLTAVEQKSLIQLLRKLVFHHYSLPKETR
ncbi:MAG TPA: MarR family transcriptional regulator [bacterium]|jgi:DNA-binding MarR family transcriptional regulator|nr:MarR family transcriptional regulator [bacterium]